MKKLLALVIAISLCLSFAGCVEDNPTNNEDASSDVVVQTISIPTTTSKNTETSNTNTSVTTTVTTSVKSTVTSKPIENVQQESNSQIVYITATGKKYHSTKSCSGLSNAKAIYDSTLSEAKSKNLGPCSKCH